MTAEQEMHRPPAGVAPRARAFELVLARTDEVAVVLGPMFVWSNGIRLSVWLWPRDPGNPLDPRDFELTTVPPLNLTRQGGTAGSWNYWLWPLPPPGPLTFVCAWPSQGLLPTKAEIDAAPLREAASRAASW